MTKAFSCASCGEPVTQTFLDLGEMPSANSYLRDEDLAKPEARWPLRAAVCPHCFLVQLDHQVDPRHLFGNYAYFSSYSSSWVEHARSFAAAATDRFGLGPSSLVIEVASNDGYLLRHFKAAGIQVLGIEPAANVAAAAQALGIETRTRFFGRALAEELVAEGLRADLVCANNVLAHVPTINDFVAGFATVLKPDGVLSVEFPHLIPLIDKVEFDTIYHEHFFYYSLLAVEAIFARNGLAVFDAETLATHGGSLRVYGARVDGSARSPSAALQRLRALEAARKLDRIETYAGFEQRVRACREEALSFFAECRRSGARVVGYGAAAKGNTFLNYLACGPAEIEFVADRNPVKQGTYLPGSRIPVRAPEAIAETRPDWVLILPWNLSDEIVQSLAGIRQWGGRFVTMVPTVQKTV